MGEGVRAEVVLGHKMKGECEGQRWFEEQQSMRPDRMLADASLQSTQNAIIQSQRDGKGSRRGASEGQGSE